LHYDDLGDEHQLNYKRNDNRVFGSNSISTSIGYNRVYNQRREWAVNYQRQKSTLTSDTFSISENHVLPHEFELKNTAYYQRNELSTSNSLYDESLRTHTILTKTIPELGTITTEYSDVFDPDGDRVTQDLTTFVKKQPEMTIDFKPLKVGIINVLLLETMKKLILYLKQVSYGLLEPIGMSLSREPAPSLRHYPLILNYLLTLVMTNICMPQTINYSN